MGVRGGRLQAPRHLRVPLRDDQGAARRAGPVGGRPGLRGADGPGARGLPGGRAGGGGRTRSTPITRTCSASLAGPDFTTRFVGYETTEAETRAARRRGTRTAGCWPSSRRAPSTRRAAARCPTPGSWRRRRDARGSWTSTASATTRHSRSSRSRARSGRARPCGPLVERDTRLATMRNHTATHLLHAALRERLGTHVRQAGSYVGPDKLRFDFTHGERLSDAELADVEAWVAGRIAAAHNVHALETTRDEAEALGAMALFGEKYGDWVRMVEIDGRVARALRRHARGEHGRARPVPPAQRDLERVERAPHRGGDRSPRRRAVP